MKKMVILVVVFCQISCIPLRIAPTIESYKVENAKKFKRGLPNRYAFVFEDNKDANEFYYYINGKFKMNNQDVAWNVPFEIGEEQLYFSFYEVEIPTKTINLIPLFVSAALANQGYDPLLEDMAFSRTGNWYIAIVVSDEEMNDALNPNSKYQKRILNYLNDLRQEYYRTAYYDLLSKNNAKIY